MEKSEEKSIELLPPETFEEYSLGKKLTAWIINVGRLIIIGTELIAFSVFIARINLDRDLTDLTNALENQLTILENSQDFEGDFRNLQQQLRLIKDLRQEQIPTGKVVSLISSLLPQNVDITGLTLQPSAEGGSEADENEASLTARTGSATAFAQTILNLKNSIKIDKIALTSGRFSAKDGTYHFSLTIKFSKEVF